MTGSAKESRHTTNNLNPFDIQEVETFGSATSTFVITLHLRCCRLENINLHAAVVVRMDMDQIGIR